MTAGKQRTDESLLEINGETKTPVTPRSPTPDHYAVVQEEMIFLTESEPDFKPSPPSPTPITTLELPKEDDLFQPTVTKAAAKRKNSKKASGI